ncbi:hypothetical protein FPV67DRAFT_1705061 [Lyophyllum atratum]|nr:hypothetical protein FPV67DRAFT_1705061 [Lyophyllum atratum]
MDANLVPFHHYLRTDLLRLSFVAPSTLSRLAPTQIFAHSWAHSISQIWVCLLYTMYFITDQPEWADIDRNLIGETEAQLSQMAISFPEADATMGEISYMPKGISKLPREMFLEIFEHFTAEPALIGFKVGASSPMTLTQVSSSWRSMAFSTPKLWNNIIIDCGDWSRMPQLTTVAHAHLNRSGTMKVSIRTTGSVPEGSVSLQRFPIQNLVSPFANRIQHLTLAFPQEWLNTFLYYNIAGSQIPALESVKIVYHRTRNSRDFDTINLFSNAPRLRSFEVDCISPWTWVVPESMFNLPFGQLKDLRLIHFTLSREELPSLLGRCHTLEDCTMFISNDSQTTMNTFPITALPSIRSLTLHNVKNYNYDKYMERVALPSLENFNVEVVKDNHNSGKWDHAQFSSLSSRSSYALRTFFTTAHISNVDIESVMGEMPSLVELNVLEGEAISASTLRLLCKGLLAPCLEVIKCVVDPDMLSDFLDMLDCRYVPQRKRAGYRGIRSVVIRCSMQSKGYKDVQERLKEEFSGHGRSVTVMGH